MREHTSRHAASTNFLLSAVQREPQGYTAAHACCEAAGRRHQPFRRNVVLALETTSADLSSLQLLKVHTKLRYSAPGEGSVDRYRVPCISRDADSIHPNLQEHPQLTCEDAVLDFGPLLVHAVDAARIDAQKG